MSFRSLRAANQSLYLGTTLIVLAACAFTIWQGERPAWQQWLAAAAAVACLAWGGYYTLLRYQVDAMGITRHSLFRRKGILWAELAETTLEEQHSMETTRLAVHFRSTGGTTLTLSSDLLPLDAMEELIAELREQGHLPAAEEDA